MNRRAATATTVLLHLGMLVGVALGPIATAGAAGSIDRAAMAAPEPPPVPVTINDFVPENRDIGDCLGALERPGCGSKDRGGWRQAAVFGAVVAGMGVVFWRVVAGVRRNRRRSAAQDA